MNNMIFAAACLSAASISNAQAPLVIEFDQPTLDRWMYPLNGTPGGRNAASVFGALGQEMIEGLTFDQRDAQFLIGFDISSELAVAECMPEELVVTEAIVTITVNNNNNFRYDPTPDPFASYRETGTPGAIADTDLGRPIELFGVGYRNGFTQALFFENSAWGPGVAWEVRNAFAVDFDAFGSARDVSNNVSGSPSGVGPLMPFEPNPFAVGQIDAVAPGQNVPTNSVVTFTIDVDDEHIQQHIREGVAQGEVRFMISSLQNASFFTQDGSFASFYTKENIFSVGRRATLRLVLECAPDTPGCTADLDGNDSVNLDDFSIFIAQFGNGPADCVSGCTADLDGNDSVNLDDFSIFIAQFGNTPAECDPQ